MTQDEQWLLQEKYHGEKTEGFFADSERLRHDEPLAYIIGSIPFLHTTVFLDSHPLIPRTETEYWVEKIILEIHTRGTHPYRILDLCAGSGCIGISILKNIQNVLVDFEELDVQHHATIQKNIIQNNIDVTRTKIIGGNLFENVTETYDLILSNPPYIDQKIDRVEKSVRKYEPENALYGGKDGTEFISCIIEESAKFLTNDGLLVIEHEPEQVDYIHAHGTLHGFASTSHSDQFGILRYTRLTRI